MATKTIKTKLHFEPSRTVMFRNLISKVDQDPPMVNNIVQSEIMPRHVGPTSKIPTSESSPKLDARKILSQEITLTSDAPLLILEMLEIAYNNNSVDAILIKEVCKYLKNNGKDLDRANFKEALDHYFSTIRNLSRIKNLDTPSRTMLLEVIELRACGWSTTEEHAAFYAKQQNLSANPTRVNQPTPVNLTTSTSSPSIIPTNVCQSSQESDDTVIAPSSSGDIIKNSGKFQKPVKVPGKNFLKDEFVIKNSDSGKVSPGAKDRLLQITGPDESSINKAKYYIEDTIKRNASPIPCDQQTQTNQLNQPRNTSASSPAVNKLLSNEEPNTPHMQTISIGNDIVIIASSVPKLALEARTVLEEHFRRKKMSGSFKNESREPSESSDSDISVIQFRPVNSSNGNLTNITKNDEWGNLATNSFVSSEIKHFNKVATKENMYQKSASHGSLATGNRIQSTLSIDRKDALNGKKIVYDRDFLLKCSKSEICKIPPNDVKIVARQIPDIARKPRQTRANSVESAVA